MTDDLPGLDDLGELERHDLAEVVQDGRAVDDPHLARAAVELARRQRRLAVWMMAGLLGLPVVIAGIVPLVTDGALEPVLLLAAFVVMAPIALGFGWSQHADAVAAERANQALLDGTPLDPDAPPSVNQRIGAALLALLVALFGGRLVVTVIWAALRAIGVDLAAAPSWVQAATSLAVMGPIWFLGYRALTSRTSSR